MEKLTHKLEHELVPEEEKDGDYPLLRQLDLLKLEMEKLLIAKEIRSQIYFCLNEENFLEFNHYLASQLSSDSINNIRTAVDNFGKKQKNNKEAVDYFLFSLSTIGVNIIYQLLIKGQNDDADKILTLIINFLTIFSIVMSAKKLSESATDKKISGTKKYFKEMKEPELMEQLYDYLYIIRETKKLGEKFSVSGKAKIRILGQHLKEEAEKQQKNISEIMLAIDEILKQPAKVITEKERATVLIRILGHILEMMPLVEEADKYQKTPLLTNNQLASLN